MKAKNNLMEAFNNYLQESATKNTAASFSDFETTLSKADETVQVKALQELLKSNGSEIAPKFGLKDAFVTTAVGQALRNIFRNNPNLLYSKEGGKYKFLDDVVHCSSDLRGYIYDDISARKDNAGKDFLNEVLDQAVTQNESLVSNIVGSRIITKQREVELLEKAMVKNPDLATEMIKKGVESQKTTKFMKNNWSISDLDMMLSDHISAINPNRSSYGFGRDPQRLPDSLLKSAWSEYISKEKEQASSLAKGENAIKGSSHLLTRVINIGDKKLICDMALMGFKLDKDSLDLTYGNDTAAKLAQELRDNKNPLYQALGSKSLTDNDVQRIALLASSNMHLDEQKQYLKKHKGVSPLKLAIDTEQFDIAAKMIADGASLKSSELSIGDRLRSAVGLIDIKDVSAFKLAQSQDPKKKEMKFTDFVKEKKARAGYSQVK